MENSLKFNFHWLLLILIPIFSWGCFWFVGFPHYIEKIMALAISVLLLLFFFISGIREVRLPNDKVLVVFLVISFISIINAYLYWEQSPALTFSSCFGIYIYIYYFVLKKFNVTQTQIKNLLIFFSILYMVLWLYAFSQAPEVVFGNAEEIQDNRGMYRVQLNGIDLVCLLYFYSINRVVCERKYGINLFLAIVSFLFIFSSLSRMLIAAAVLVTLFLIFKRASFKILLIVGLFFVLFYGYVMRNEVVNNLIELQETQSETGSDKLIRNEYTDCFNLFPVHIGTFLFGNGAAHPSSEYGKREESLKSTYGFHRSDAGFPSLYVTYGFVSLLLIAVLFIRILNTKIPDHYYHYKLYIIFFIITSITTDHFVHSGVSLMITLYSLSIFETKKSLERV